MSHPAVKAGNTAVITGGASGIGLATAQKLSAAGMNICIADMNDDAMTEARQALPDALIVKTDVSDISQVEALKEAAFDQFGNVSILMNNAGRGGGGGSFANLDGWHKVLGTNLWGVIHGLQVFTQSIIDQGIPAAIINTGSKQGITNPPGDAAYNVSKAGIRTVTEHLAHELRNIDDCQVTAHLLVPGFTYTGLIKRFVAEQPPAAWSSEQVADELLTRLGNGDFYIICPDNDVTTEMDNLRIQWNTNDITQNRPALSRWHKDFEADFAAFMKDA